jgi:DNA-binding MarR family transcriptional regulator
VRNQNRSGAEIADMYFDWFKAYNHSHYLHAQKVLKSAAEVADQPLLDGSHLWRYDNLGYRTIRQPKGCDGLDPPLEQFEESLDRVNRVLNHLTQVFLTQRGMSMPRYRILRYLQSRSDVNMREMQGNLLVCGSTLTELVDGLVRSGLVLRVRDQGDRRMVYLRLTGEGREAYREVLALRCDYLKKVLAGKGAGLEGINAFLNGVYAGLKQQIAMPGGEDQRPAGQGEARQKL